MKFLKRILIGVYVFLGVFTLACLILWAILGEEPAALIAGVCGAAGVESVAGALMKWKEISARRAEESEKERKG